MGDIQKLISFIQELNTNNNNTTVPGTTSTLPQARSEDVGQPVGQTVGECVVKPKRPLIKVSQFAFTPPHHPIERNFHTKSLSYNDLIATKFKYVPSSNTHSSSTSTSSLDSSVPLPSPVPGPLSSTSCSQSNGTTPSSSLISLNESNKNVPLDHDTLPLSSTGDYSKDDQIIINSYQVTSDSLYKSQLLQSSSSSSSSSKPLLSGNTNHTDSSLNITFLMRGLFIAPSVSKIIIRGYDKFFNRTLRSILYSNLYIPRLLIQIKYSCV
jgi:hypothetical protein